MKCFQKNTFLSIKKWLKTSGSSQILLAPPIFFDGIISHWEQIKDTMARQRTESMMIHGTAFSPSRN